MNSDPWHIAPLAPTHDSASFDCGTEDMNRYLREQAGQNSKQNVSRTYVAALRTEPPTVGGYYTLTLRSVGFRELPKEKRLPRYPIPLIHLGRLAVSLDFLQGQGLGRRLLLDALYRALRTSEESGGFAVEVYALHEQAAGFYGKYGFVPLDDDPLHLYLGMKAIRTLGL